MADTISDNIEIFPHDADIDIDGFVLGENSANVEFSPEFEALSPEISEDDGKIYISFGKIKYVVQTECGEYVVRKIISDDIGQTLSEKIHDHVSSVLEGIGNSETADIFMGPIFVGPHSSETVTLKITAEYTESFPENHEIYMPNFN